jgi:Carbonic anhydrase
MGCRWEKGRPVGQAAWREKKSQKDFSTMMANLHKNSLELYNTATTTAFYRTSSYCTTRQQGTDRYSKKGTTPALNLQHNIMIPLSSCILRPALFRGISTTAATALRAAGAVAAARPVVVGGGTTSTLSSNVHFSGGTLNLRSCSRRSFSDKSKKKNDPAAAAQQEDAAIETLMKHNRDWVDRTNQEDPDFFPELGKGQSPEYLYIGCSDSRVAISALTGLNLGEVFVHRNIANMVVSADLNLLSVLTYAVEHLKVKHSTFLCVWLFLLLL